MFSLHYIWKFKWQQKKQNWCWKTSELNSEINDGKRRKKQQQSVEVKRDERFMPTKHSYFDDIPIESHGEWRYSIVKHIVLQPLQSLQPSLPNMPKSNQNRIVWYIWFHFHLNVLFKTNFIFSYIEYMELLP